MTTNALIDPRLLGTRFDIVRRVGQGGMGTVYEAFDRERQSRVALKTLRHITQEGLRLFKREFRSIADVEHPNLVSLYELFAEDGFWFFTMEYLEGSDLLGHFRGATTNSYTGNTRTMVDEMTSTVVSSGLQFWQSGFAGVTARVQNETDSARVRNIFCQIANGICAIHEAGMLHRDLKPNNILVTEQERAIVLDFGIAIAAADTATTTRVVSGTPSHMSPEQAAGQPLSEATDWYALGVMLFQVLTGGAPFTGTADTVMRSKIHRDAPSTKSLAPSAPSDLAALCDDLLGRNPRDRPSAREIIDRLAAPAQTGRFRGKRGSAFVGRERELDAMRTAMDRVAMGQPSLALVSGASGVGKSTLAREFLEREKRRNALVLRGRCFEQESVPFKAWDAVLDDLAAVLDRNPTWQSDAAVPGSSALAQIFPVLRSLPVFGKASGAGGDAVDRRRQAFHAFQVLLRRLALRRPTIIVIDDLQWGDLDSIALLAEVIRTTEAAPVLLMCLYRSEEAANSACLRALEDLLRDRPAVHVTRIAVEPLPTESSMELAATLLDGKADLARLQKIAEESGGNAFFIHELCEEGDSSIARGENVQSLDGVIARRIADLPEDARTLLEAIAVHGRPLAQADVYGAAGLRSMNLQPVRTLRARRLIRSRGFRELDQVEAYHDRVRETVVKNLPVSTRQLRHLALAQQLERSGRGEAESLAYHFEGGGELPTAGRWYRVAGVNASQSLAFEQAADHLRRALALLPLEEAEQGLLRGDLADALANAGRGLDAGQEFQTAAATAPTARRREFQRRAGYQYCAAGYLSRGRSILEDMLAADGIRLPKRDSAVVWGLLRELVLLALRGVRWKERAPEQNDSKMLERLDTALAATAVLQLADQFRGLLLANCATRMALKCGDPARLIRALMFSAPSCWVQGALGRRISPTLAACMDNLVARYDCPEHRARLAMARGSLIYLQGDLKQAAEFHQEAVSLFESECQGTLWEIVTNRIFLLYCYSLGGEYARCDALVRQALDDAARRGDLYERVMVGSWGSAFMRLVEDRPAEASQEVQDALEEWHEPGFHVAHMTGFNLQIYADFYTGMRQMPFSAVASAWSEMRRKFFDRNEMLRGIYRSILARACLREASESSGRERERWMRDARMHAKSLRGETNNLGRGFSAATEGAVLEVAGSPVEAAAAFGRAHALFVQQHWGTYGMSCLRKQGSLLGGEAGSRVVTEADTWFRARGVIRPDRFAECFAGGYR
jgi:tetratricopeptide (TPR) repeat protein